MTEYAPYIIAYLYFMGVVSFITSLTDSFDDILNAGWRKGKLPFLCLAALWPVVIPAALIVGGYLRYARQS